MTDQIIVFVTLVLTLVLFINGRWHYDIVTLIAMFALLAPVTRLVLEFHDRLEEVCVQANQTIYAIQLLQSWSGGVSVVAD